MFFHSYRQLVNIQDCFRTDSKDQYARVIESVYKTQVKKPSRYPPRDQKDQSFTIKMNDQEKKRKGQDMSTRVGIDECLMKSLFLFCMFLFFITILWNVSTSSSSSLSKEEDLEKQVKKQKAKHKQVSFLMKWS